MNKRPIQKRSSKTTQFGLSATVSDQFNLAVSLHQRHEFARAAQLYSSVLGEYPEHFDALQLYAVLLAQTGQLTKALNLLIKAVEVAPTQGVERSSLAGVYNNLGNTYKGLAEFEQALKTRLQCMAEPSAVLKACLQLMPELAPSLKNQFTAMGRA